MLSVRQIEIFRAVMSHQSTVGAARELGISQPSISNAIRHMEDQIGFPLFDRTGNRLSPRQEAQLLYRGSEGIFQLSRALNQMVEEMRADLIGHVRIVATPQLGHGVVPKAISQFLQDRPKVKVFLDISQSHTVLENVEMAVADIGLAIGLEKELAHTYEMTALGKAKLMCFVPHDHPLAAKRCVRPADLVGHSLVGLDVNSRIGSFVRAAFRAEAVPYSTGVEVRFSETACYLVEAGAGITIVDEYTGITRTRSNPLTRLVPFEPSSSIGAWAVHLRSRPPSRIALQLIETIRQCLT